MEFKFKVSDGFFPMEFEGTQIAATKKIAIEKIKEFYAHELDTTEDQINIIELVEIK